ncbi:MAG: phytanoyl-CoA dioxygenase family protein [Chitinophagales bacterium]
MNRLNFINTSVNESFDRLGYAVIDLLNRNDVPALRKKALSWRSGVSHHFYTSFWSEDPNYRLQVDQFIKETIWPRAQQIFSNFRPVLGDLLVKRPSLFRHFPLHQDWTFVDESNFTSIYIWMPLQDVDVRNGCLHVVPGSHQILDKVRGPNINPTYEKYSSKLSEFLVPVPLKAGQAVVFSQALLHSSPPNRSFLKRVAMGLLVIPEEAKLIHCHYDVNRRRVDQYDVTPEFYQNYSNGKNFKAMLQSSQFESPSLKPASTSVTVNMDVMSENEVLERIRNIYGTV